MDRKVVVIGAGVIGLSCALSIQTRLAQQQQQQQQQGGTRYQVVIVAAEFPQAVAGAPSDSPPSVNYASMWAGAHVRPIPGDTPQLRCEAAWLKDTVRHFDQGCSGSLAHQPQAWMLGVTRCTGREFLEAPSEAYRAQTKTSFEAETGLTGYRRLSGSRRCGHDTFELPLGVGFGFEYQTYCINPPVYCASLLRKFLSEGGVALERRQLQSVDEAFDLFPGSSSSLSSQDTVDLVVNASGTGFGDPECFPTRGQTVLTSWTGNGETVTRQHRDGAWTFIIPRFLGGGTIVGGTKEVRDWRVEPATGRRDQLLASASVALGNKVVAEGLAGSRVIMDVVGRRPTREGGMRIEVEHQPMFAADTQSGKKTRPVVHAYGAGGRGFEISWGVADEVTALVMSTLNIEHGQRLGKARF
ncbi:uncharacterized protein B0I36DRAFT_378217 [Microdochium trichocladiopsis]|uniref:FAD dependent oxidoreductase domain-containing protein n=1 Tax=Microdochium trichocladiopsis TaxID=1682393 RepID=A0A9P8XSE5_9PEZI|nr:uncharacterized protein B0I36DRAFT_378217 [Microdochium trichocladiopsis]KAH7014559.1 hypothetical protein B0I36DRAFT_378217 [Microdochium trichocladiopsis]